MPSVFRGQDDFDTAGGNAIKAWANFNGTGTPSIRAAFNVSSVARNGSGDYTVNFTNALADTNYSVMGLGYGGSAYRGYTMMSESSNSDLNRTTSSVRFQMYRGGSSTGSDDVLAVNMQVLR